MLQVTGIENHRYFTGEGTWLDRYCQLASSTRFPMSYHLLAGLFALTTTVGRNCRMRLPGYVLWPPISVLLIAESGSGKTQSLKIARHILRVVKDNLATPFYLTHEDTWTPSGLMDIWQKWQSEKGEGHSWPLEGAYTCDEAGTVLKATTGKESAPEFLINALEHEDLVSTTVSRGQRTVQDLCLAFGLTSTVSGVRSSLSAEIFSGGFMHRFLIAHEIEKDRRDCSGFVDEQSKRDLAYEAIDIRQQAPDAMEIPEETMQEYYAMENRSESQRFTLSCLRGFWNRFSGYAMKLGCARALSDHRYTITPDDLLAAETLIREFLYQPLAELVKEIAAPPKMKRMYEISDNLLCAGPEGMSDLEMREQIGPTWDFDKSTAYMEMVGLASRGQHNWNGDRWYRKKGWSASMEVIEGGLGHGD